ncbi:MAG: hypothetical protein ACI8RZ_007856, partial [Myxococcota bacterium]
SPPLSWRLSTMNDEKATPSREGFAPPPEEVAAYLRCIQTLLGLLQS